MGALPPFGAPQGGIIWKSKNDVFSEPLFQIELKFDVEHLGN